jgi:UDP-galactopyranose mutase
MYDLIVVGAGLFGSTFAYLAKQLGQKVLVVEQRNHIGGNCYTSNNQNIIVHDYGAHIFHTSNKNVWNFINQFAEFNSYIHYVKANYEDNIYSLPFNMATFYKLWGTKTPAEARRKLYESCIHIQNPQNLEEFALSQVGIEIYEKLIFGYTKKQWGYSPSELPIKIIQRIPLYYSWHEHYFNDLYQGIPNKGYTQIFEKMLNGCEIQLGVDYIKDIKNLKLSKNTLYTGEIDKFFNYCYGKLQYRAVRFKNEIINNIDSYLGIAVMNYTSEHTPFTRIIEHKLFNNHCVNDNSRSIISYEYSSFAGGNDVPSYPIHTQNNLDLYQKYYLLSKQSDVMFGGRLAMYEYVNMDQIILMAMNLFESYKKDI